METPIFIAAGILLIVMAVASSVLKRLPLSTAMVYLIFGIAIGPFGLGLLSVSPTTHVELLERLTEIAVIISLFTAGLKLRTPLRDSAWRLTWRLATLAMFVTIGVITLAGVYLLHLPVGASLLLGALLAPTDPVLAAEVQVEDTSDRDRLRFSLTGEAGLNDGAAFPFVMLGLGLLGLHNVGSLGARWLIVDVMWASLGGLVVGSVLGWLIASLVLHLRREYSEALGLDDFLALGLIALSYGVAVQLHTYGFLAVFAAGLALRRVEMQSSGTRPPRDVLAAGNTVEANELASHPNTAPAYMAEAVLGFNEQLERIAAAVIVTMVGVLLHPRILRPEVIGFAALVLIAIRPLAVWIGLVGSATSVLQRSLIGWFGIRGIGSLYYLMYAIRHGVSGTEMETLVAVTLVTITLSVVVHGISVTPLMSRYAQRAKKRQGKAQGLV